MECRKEHDTMGEILIPSPQNRGVAAAVAEAVKRAARENGAARI